MELQALMAKQLRLHLCYEIFRAKYGNQVKLVGNVGVPISTEVLCEYEQRNLSGIKSSCEHAGFE